MIGQRIRPRNKQIATHSTHTHSWTISFSTIIITCHGKSLKSVVKIPCIDKSPSPRRMMDLSKPKDLLHFNGNFYCVHLIAGSQRQAVRKKSVRLQSFKVWELLAGWPKTTSRLVDKRMPDVKMERMPNFVKILMMTTLTTMLLMETKAEHLQHHHH